MLDPEKIKMFDQAAGLQTQPREAALGKTRADEIRTLAATPQVDTGGALQSVARGIGKGELSLLKDIGGVGTKIVDQTAGRVSNLVQGKGFTPTHTENVFTKDSPVLEATNLTEKVAKGLTELGAQLVVAPEIAVDKLGMSGLTWLAEHGKLTTEAVQKASKFVASKWGAKAVQVLNDFVAGAGFKEASNVASGESGGVATAGATTAVSGQILRPVVKAVMEPMQTLQNAKNFIAEKIGGKTSKEILATPETEVGKLTARQQKHWYQNQARTSSQEAQQASLAARQAHDRSMKELRDEITGFNQKIGEGSRDKAIALKKPAQQLMRDSSDRYLELTGEAADTSPALSKKLSSEELTSAIDSKFEYNPEAGATLKRELGLTEKTPPTQIDAESGLPVIKSEAPPLKYLTNQEILDKARDIMQTVSKTARQGSRVYTPDEYQAMQKYSFLMDVLEKNGVDMSEANSFWKNWAPVRDRIVREIKPFDETNIGKVPFSSTLQKSEATAKTGNQTAAKLDAQNFVSEIEKQLELPKGSLGADIRKAVQGAEQAKLTQENLDKAYKEVQTKMRTDRTEALKNMSAQKYDNEEIAIRRARIKYALVGLGVLTASHLTGIDKSLLKAVGVVF